MPYGYSSEQKDLKILILDWLSCRNFFVILSSSYFVCFSVRWEFSVHLLSVELFFLLQGENCHQTKGSSFIFVSDASRLQERCSILYLFFWRKFCSHSCMILRCQLVSLNYFCICSSSVELLNHFDWQDSEIFFVQMNWS